MEINQDRIGDSCGNFPQHIFARICTISDNYDFHRTRDVSEIKNCLG